MKIPSLNYSVDCEKYLQSGKITQSFLSDDLVKDKIMYDYNHKSAVSKEYTILDSLFAWLHKNIKHCNNPQIRSQKFNRTAKEIWESGMATGCTDYAIVFATLSRQMGIPTTVLHTAESGWISRFINNQDYKLHVGHTFCECYYNGKWVLVDPTNKRIENKYDTDVINLSYTVNNSNTFIPYLRSVDLPKKMSVKEFNDQMEELCR